MVEPPPYQTVIHEMEAELAEIEANMAKPPDYQVAMDEMEAELAQMKRENTRASTISMENIKTAILVMGGLFCILLHFLVSSMMLEALGEYLAFTVVGCSRHGEMYDLSSAGPHKYRLWYDCTRSTTTTPSSSLSMTTKLQHYWLDVLLINLINLNDNTITKDRRRQQQQQWLLHYFLSFVLVLLAWILCHWLVVPFLQPPQKTTTATTTTTEEDAEKKSKED